MKKTLLLILGVVALAQVRPVAWGAAGHRVISRAAVLALPSDVPPFLARQIDWIGSRSVLADSWRMSTEPFAKISEDPNHVWHTEQLAFMTHIPRSRTEFVLAVYDQYLKLKTTDPGRAAYMNIYYTGTLPYAATEAYERLKVAFRGWRELRAQKQDTTFIEQDAAFYVGWMSHYIADAAQPMHTSVEYDGWIGDNPKHYTTEGGIHWKFENTFVDLIDLNERDIQARIPAPAHQVPDVFTAVLDHIRRSHARVERTYELDLRHAYDDKTDKDGRELIYQCTSDAAALVRDLIYTAWVTSEAPPPPPGTLDPANNPKNPLYNPATGSAPPPAPRR
jgi:hypothetical protein